MDWTDWARRLAAGVVLLGAGVAGAEDRPLQIERDSVAYTVAADGSYVEVRETETSVLKDTALAWAKDASVSYSTSVQSAEIVAAYTLKPDGRRIDVPPGNYQVNRSGGQGGDSPIYSDQTTLTAVFPELAVGDRTVFSYRLTTRVPMFEKQFSVIRSFNPATYYGDVKVVVDAPAGMKARADAWQMRKAERGGGGRRITEWSWSNREPVDPESLRDSTYNVERLPGYAYSTFSSYADVARAYWAGAEPKAAVTPRIRTLADEASAGAEGEREIAGRLYEWVSRNITYAGNCIGIGAVVPRDLDVVLDNRMGDCKDQATLLQAMLQAKGIASTQALVNAGGVYALPEIPVASMVNHVINYVPSLDLYLDATPGNVPFGSLPQSVAGKRVLLVDGYRDDSATPGVEAGRDWQRLATTLRIRDDGSVAGTHVVKLGGQLALAARETFRNMPAGDIDKLVRRYFQQMGLKASGTIRHDDPEATLEQFELSADFDVEHLLPVPGGLRIQPWFISFAPVSTVAAVGGQADDQPAGESSCGGILTEETYVFEFPESVEVAAIPADFATSGDNLNYEASYRLDGRKVHISRAFSDRTPGPVCSAEYNTARRKALEAIQPDLRAQIVYLRRHPERQ